MIGDQAHLVRKAQIERLSSPEELDTPMRVTTPAAWVMLGFLGVGIIAAVIWLVVGRLPVKVDGFGMLMQGEDIRTVQSKVAGKVETLSVKKGDVVAVGDEVATLRLTELEAEIATSRSRITDLERTLEKHTRDMQRMRQTYDSVLRGMRSRLQRMKSLKDSGDVSRPQVMEVEEEIAATEAKILESEMRESTAAQELADEKRNLKKLLRNLQDNSIILSTAEGRVAALMVSQNDLVAPGDRILNLQGGDDQPFRLILFVKLAEGRKVEPGFEVQISPTTHPPEEYGVIRGDVVEVSASPVTHEEVKRTFNNDALAERFTEENPYRVDIAPRMADGADPAEPLFEWTSAKGRGVRLDGNRPCSAQVIVEQRRPITLIIPKLKEVLGLS